MKRFFPIRKWVAWNEIRTFSAIVLLWAPLLCAADAGSQALDLLIAGFGSQPAADQPKVLRRIGLLQSKDAVPFLASVAIDGRYENDARREALKAMLAIDSAAYRPVLEPLSSSVIDSTAVLNALLDIGDPRFSEVAVRFASRKNLDAVLRRASVVAALDLWKGEEKPRPPFELWRKTRASAVLEDVVKTVKGERQVKAAKALGWVSVKKPAAKRPRKARKKGKRKRATVCPESRPSCTMQPG